MATAQQIAAVIAGRLATTNSPIRLRVENSGNALDAAKAFAAGTADLAWSELISAISSRREPWR